MKKILTLSIILAFSTNLTFAATSYTSALKDAVKKDIEASKTEAKNYNQSVKNAIKKDIETKINANTAAQKAQRAQKNKELEAKIKELKEERTTIMKTESMSYTEKTLRTKSIDKQIEMYTLQLVSGN